MSALLAGLTLYCVAIGIVQLTFLLGLGAVESRRMRRASSAADGEAPAWEPESLFAIVPCLNEALVIGPTVTALLEADPRLRVVVVDDASDDETGEAARLGGGGDSRLQVLRRELPEAQLGKGPALNHAFAHITARVDAEGLDPERVLVVVMDADGRLSPGAVGKVGALFADPEVGGAQLGVRIRNRADNVLATIQDCEFWGIAALGQLGRVRTHTVSLGGNGQFARLSALRSIGDAPWSDALTEDLDLAITMTIAGWRLSSRPDAWVSQQGLTGVRPLIRQRTRWFQGHMTTALTRMGDLWRSPSLSNASLLEVTSYLLIPFVIVLPWSVLSQVGLLTAGSQLADRGLPTGDSGLPGPTWLLPLLVWYLLSFLPTIICGLVYARREPAISLLGAIALAHLLVVWNYVLFISCWAALFRMVRGRTGWVKTARLDEGAGPPLAGATR